MSISPPLTQHEAHAFAPAIDLPSLKPIPDDIEEQLAELLKTPARPELEEWLIDLIKSSGHLSTSENLRWRVFCMIWLAGQFSVDKAWPYLMWFNMQDDVISDHLCEMLVEGANELNGHINISSWLAQSDDDRFIKFMSEFYNVPASNNMISVLHRLMSQPHSETASAWLRDYCQSTLDNRNSYVQPWRLVTATWYATVFNPTDGLFYLQKLAGGNSLSAEQQKTLREHARKFNGLADFITWTRNCSDSAVRKMLGEFWQVEPSARLDEIFSQPPQFDHLSMAAPYAADAAHVFQQVQERLQKAAITPGKKPIFVLGGGSLAPLAGLLGGLGYSIEGADSEIPPQFWSPSLLQRLKKGKYVSAWEEATVSYYRHLSQASGQAVNWRNVSLKMENPNHVSAKSGQFEAVIAGQLHQQADVAGALSEAARLLKPGGVLIGHFQPFGGPAGGYQSTAQVTAKTAWRHLDPWTPPPSPTPFLLNRWAETEYHQTLETAFEVESWHPETHPLASEWPTPTLTRYSPAELGHQHVFFVARKK